ncbi:MAG: hypothetical protein Q4C76_05950 [Bacillota bacterium]|nr:hypothetical protein [Bacillota bacterium]
MCFDDPIFLDHDAFDDLMADTERHRICWMYHDILSDPKIARMFADCAGHGRPVREAWTTMAWVAAGQQENSFYLLFKWYTDFYGPPERGDLYYIERDQGFEGEMRVRLLDMDLLKELGRRGMELCNGLWNRISENASYYFGESDYETNAMAHILHLLDDNPGQELETFDWYLGRQSDGEKAAQCLTIAAYFHGVQSVKEMIYHIVVTDGGESDVHNLHTRDFLEILNRITAAVDGKRLSELSGVFQALADEFCYEPARGPAMNRNMARAMMTLTESGGIQWIRLGGHGRKKLLRELYCRCDPRRAWDVFHRWQGELYFTVFRRSPIRGLHRGVYLVSRFEDQRGMDITDLFWLEHVSGGVVHLCEGDFFEELMDRLLAEERVEITLHGGRRRAEDLPATYAALLKEAYDRLERGLLQRRSPDRDRIY